MLSDADAKGTTRSMKPNVRHGRPLLVGSLLEMVSLVNLGIEIAVSSLQVEKGRTSVQEERKECPAARQTEGQPTGC